MPVHWRQKLLAAVAVVLAMQLSVYWLTLGVGGHWIKRTAPERLREAGERGKVVKLRFSRTQLPADLYWMENHESRYQGLFYDILEKVETADSLLLRAVPDYGETEFWENAYRQMTRQDTPGSPTGAQLALWLVKAPLPAELGRPVFIVSLLAGRPFGHARLSSLHAAAPPTPPPRF